MQKENLEELLSRGVEEIIVKSEVEKALKSGKQIRIYYGVDPSGPVIHLGHAVILRRLSKLQEMGHKIIFLIGDFTGMIGDPTDREAVRVPLTREKVLENAKTYKKQIAKFLNLSGKNAAEIRFNSEWNDKLSFKEVIELASRFTVQQLLERDMFQKRMAAKKPISLQEFMYPIVQGYDAVMLDADMQVGGTDQLFNMLQGRQLMKSLKNKNQTVMTFTLLEGTDGRKMSKSFNNVIAIEDEPNDMYGKVMSVKDELILQYFELATDVPMAEVKKVAKELTAGKNPRDLKAKLAFEIVKLYHGEKAAEKAAENFQKTVVNKEVPTDIPAVDLLKKPMILADILVNNELAPSKSEARRLIEQGGVKVDGTAITDRGAEVTPYSGMVIQAGKRKFIKVK